VQQIGGAGERARRCGGGAVVGAASVGQRATAETLQQRVCGQKSGEGPRSGSGGHRGAAVDRPPVEQVARHRQHDAQRSERDAKERESTGAAQSVLETGGVVDAGLGRGTRLRVAEPGQRGRFAQPLQTHQRGAERGEQECLQQEATPRRPHYLAYAVLDGLKFKFFSLNFQPEILIYIAY